MAAITVTTDINQVLNQVAGNFELLLNKEYLLRPLAIETIPNMKERIHKDGAGSDGAQIGTYSSGYMAIRTGNYANAKKTKEGKVKNAGVFTKGAKAFSDVASKKQNPRPNYNRSSDTKVIVSLTRQLENDWAVLGTEKGYGIGFNNPFNKDKAGWVEENKKRIIFNLSEYEKQYITERLQELVNGAINS